MASNSRIIVNVEVESTCKNVVVCTKMLFQHLDGGTEKYREVLWSL
jgi:hypothetical protein